MKAIDNLRDAKESLEEAQEASGMGTRLMIGEVLEDLDRLITRTENINDDDNDD